MDNPLGIFNSMKSVLLIPNHYCILPCLMMDCQIFAGAKKQKIDYVLCVCKWVDVFPPCFDWWKLYSRKGYSQFVIYTLDDQHSLENAFPNQLSLQPEPIQMKFQVLKEKGKGDKCPAQMFSSVCFQPGANPFFTRTQDTNELAGFFSVFNLGLSLNPSTPVVSAEIYRFTLPCVSFAGVRNFLKQKKEVHFLCYCTEVN